jgi:mono/diheme cytochrome c family protein
VTARAASLAPALATVVVLGLIGCGGDDDDGGDALSPAAEEGREIARRAGCTACHGVDGEGGVGPGWVGSLGSEVELDDGTTVTIDEAYLTRAIAEPSAEVRTGFNVQMPENDLSDDEIASIVEYIVALDGPASTGTEAGG